MIGVFKGDTRSLDNGSCGLLVETWSVGLGFKA